jgi:hypothetical protein
MTWKQAALFEEPRPGSIQQFWFASATSGQLILDESEGGTKRYERFETTDSGASWESREVAAHEVTLPQARPREYASWRIRSDAKAYRVERKTAAETWEIVASFAIQTGDCR